MTTLYQVHNHLKTLLISGAVTVSLMLTPTISMADKGSHGSHPAKYSAAAKQHPKGHKINHNQFSKHHYSKKQPRNNKHSHIESSRHKHRHDYGHKGHKHGHINYVVNDHYHAHGHVLDHLRVMIGLHTGDFDIILHQ